ncbi:peptidase M1 [Nonlabens spongiae]|uniref:Peptidase M1 n=1 Tax=Nonlabens spongiae TaxID=331648 RepID=A0A1W6MJU7_9FLAO|nr:M1 family metallopeptidase [Nonlabens spongiae]ARN77870.1 peptidase M1 [Nonlabens spongiae]
MKNIKIIVAIILLMGIQQVSAQLLQDKNQFTRQDTLRGSITQERAWWDLKYYDLEVEVFPDRKFIKGQNTITYTVNEPYQLMQVDLQAPMKITKVTQNGKNLLVTDEGNTHFIKLINNQKTGKEYEVVVHFEGEPREARNAPWDGGFSWKKDKNGKHFIATSNQGLGASVWWPCKDHMYQEPEGMTITATVPEDLICVSNGRLIKEKNKGGKTAYTWQVKNPINNYGVNLNIGDYVNFSEVYDGEKGDLDMDYWVLKDNLEKAKEHFKDAPKMMKAFEHWFGPYPFYEDSFKLVEVPYLGMEHQSSVTYGNKYVKGYLGQDLSRTGWGLKFDFIIIHEAGHEWFANNITNKDIADMWIHEGFTAYSESLFLDYHYGTDAANAYVIGTRRSIQNDRPLIGVYGVNNEGSGDMYYKGANLLHTLRQIVSNDEKWRSILRGMNETFYHRTVTTQEIEDYLNKNIDLDLKPIFDQYLRTTDIPLFKYEIKDGKLYYHYDNVVTGFSMPLQVAINGTLHMLQPQEEEQVFSLDQLIEKVEVNPNFYVGVQ